MQLQQCSLPVLRAGTIFGGGGVPESWLAGYDGNEWDKAGLGAS